MLFFKPSAGGEIILSQIVFIGVNFISTGNEVTQMHTLVDWMKDEDLD